ncbi:putative amidohydrolase [Roseiarcus fermentans]|uniref:Putative amidohydrolase n=1 Tax=Roseiarcus fermentans TaxID=1473586 RepID=A0A366F534_9HYPH|nr:carbon-nitrogen hydrolase family protein [Roseiarcus fermentans]RBP09256.1 putative amidohydrolase [Roseiarcus fermentans]
MKINLIQIDGAEWDPEHFAKYMRMQIKADLTVFPECFPLDNLDKPILHAAAIKILREYSSAFPKQAFIAGGYIKDKEKHIRNRAYLMYQGSVIEHYDKQIPFQKEDIQPGLDIKSFQWNGNKCIPLICADAYPGIDSEFMHRVIDKINAIGVGPTVPIVVCSYGAGIRDPGWRESLFHFANKCKAPVVICNIAGWLGQYKYHKRDGGDGKMHYYGGGGSGLFLPGESNPQQFEEPGIVRVDIKSGKAEWNPFA